MNLLKIDYSEALTSTQHCHGHGQNIIIQQCADCGSCSNVLIALYYHSRERDP